MDAELKKQLKDAKFPIADTAIVFDGPTLSELLNACGEKFSQLRKGQAPYEWFAQNVEDKPWVGRYGKTPEEAVAKLWLALNT